MQTKTKEQRMKEAVMFWVRWGINIATISLIGVCTNMAWKTAGILREHEKKLTVIEEWKVSWSGYPRDAKQLELTILSEVAKERTVAFRELTAQMKEIQAGLRLVELELREMRANRDGGGP